MARYRLLPGLAAFVLSAATSGDPSPSPVAAGRAPTSAPTPSPTFEATVRPILATRCAPCHNPAGKMYDRLPFDRPAVVSAHADGVRRRLKGEDLKALEKWLATLPPAPKD